NCHQEIWFGSPVLEPVRASYRNGESLAWQRLHNLPQFAYFDHSIHVNKGVGCVTCHGPVDQMPLTYQEHSLLMSWCLDCHREPQPHLRPNDAVFSMTWAPTTNGSGKVGLQQQRLRPVEELTSCSACHR